MFAFYHEWRHHIRCIITVPYGGTIRIMKVKWVPQSKTTFNDKVGKESHTYNIQLENSVMSNKNNPILWYEKGCTESIQLNKKAVGKNSRLYYTALKSKVAEDILNESKNRTIFLIIGLFVIAIIGVGLYSQFLLSEQNGKIIILTKQLAGIIANQTRAVIIR